MSMLRSRMLMAGQMTLFDHWNAYTGAADGVWTNLGKSADRTNIWACGADSIVSPLADSPAAADWGIVVAGANNGGGSHIVTAARYAISKTAKTIGLAGGWVTLRTDGPAGSYPMSMGICSDAVAWIGSHAGSPAGERVVVVSHGAGGVTGGSVSASSSPVGAVWGIRNVPGQSKCLWTVHDDNGYEYVGLHSRSGGTAGTQGGLVQPVAGGVALSLGLPLSATGGMCVYPAAAYPATIMAREIAFSGLTTSMGPEAAVAVSHINNVAVSSLHVSGPLHPAGSAANRVIVGYKSASDGKVYVRVVGISGGVITTGPALDITSAMAGATWHATPHAGIHYVADDCALILTWGGQILPLQVGTGATDLSTLKVGTLKTVAGNGVALAADYGQRLCVMGRHDVVLFCAASGLTSIYGKVISNGRTE